LQAFNPPYDGLDADVSSILESREPARGRALIWWLQDGPDQRGEYEMFSYRPAGLPLIVLLPSANAIRRTLPLLSRVVDLYPRAILPAPYLGTAEYLRHVLATPLRSLHSKASRCQPTGCWCRPSRECSAGDSSTRTMPDEACC
jgi:hypothetical protein